MINILIADDHEIFIEALESLLTDSGGVHIVAKAANGRDAIRLIEQHPEIDLAVLDVAMPIMSGIEAAEELKKRRPALPIMMLTQEYNGIVISRALRAGAAGYILKTASRTEFLEAIQTVAAGGIHVCKDANESLIAHMTTHAFPETVAVLTRREREVLKLIAAGHTTHEIAATLFISEYTAETHRRNLLRKLDLRNTADLVRYAVKNGLDED